MRKAFIFIAVASLLLPPMMSLAGSKPVLVNKPKGDRCAKETEFCRFTGKYDVYFGAGNRWMKSTHSNSNGVYCNSNVLGKHLRGLDGVPKSCYISKWMSYAERRKQDIQRKKDREQNNKRKGTKDKSKGRPIPPVGMESGARFCAHENQRCPFKGKHLVYYGSGKHSRWAIYKDGVTCNDRLGATGGPPGLAKGCWIKKVTRLVPRSQPIRPKTSAKPEPHPDIQPSKTQPSQGHVNRGTPRRDVVIVHHDHHDIHYDRSHLAEYEEKAAAAKSRGRHSSALEYYRKAAKTGDANAQFRLGNLLYDGYGSTVNHSRPKALAWWESAAKQGHHGAQFKVGDYYERHNDLQTALGWYQQAVEQNDPDAQARLGYMYLTGQGVSENPKRGLDYLHHAAEQGNAEGCYLLGVAYISGRTGSRDLGRAEHWFLKAAEQNHPHAPYELGAVFEKLGNYHKAKYWYGQAIANGNQGAMDDIHRLDAQRDHEEALENRRRKSSGDGFRGH